MQLSPFSLLAHKDSEWNYAIDLALSECQQQVVRFELIISVGHEVDAARRPVTRALSFESMDSNVEANSGTLGLADSPMSRPRKRGQPKKPKVAMVQPEERRFTRSCLKLNGYMPKLVIEKTRSRKLPRAKSPFFRLQRKKCC
jgi:hypothetical protein